LTTSSIVSRVALAGVLLILAMFVADAAGAPDWLGNVAAVGAATIAAAVGVVLLRRPR
jgi:hypothetical protein